MAEILYSGIRSVVATPYFGGRVKVSGVVSLNGVPGLYNVVLFDRKSNRALRSTRSNSDGEYAFRYLPPGDYFAVAKNHTGSPLADAINSLIEFETEA